MIIGQYFYMGSEEKDAWGKRLREDTPFEKLTRLYIAFSGINESGELAFKDDTCESRFIQLRDACRRKNHGAEIFISTHYDVADAEYYHMQLGDLEPGRFLKAAEGPEKFAKSVVEFLNKYNLNGYDIDWEYGVNNTELCNLLKALRKEMGTNYKLTRAANGADKDVLQYVDQINIMSYGRPLCDYGEFNSKIIGGIITESSHPESEAMIKEKCGLAARYGYAGMFEWRLDKDYIEEGKPTYKGANWLYEHIKVPGHGT